MRAVGEFEKRFIKRVLDRVEGIIPRAQIRYSRHADRKIGAY